MIARTYSPVGKRVRFTGKAYDFGHSIVALQFSLDGGANWTTYETPGTNDYQTLTWTLDYTPEKPGLYELRVRSVNDAGKKSPEAAIAELMSE